MTLPHITLDTVHPTIIENPRAGVPPVFVTTQYPIPIDAPAHFYPTTPVMGIGPLTYWTPRRGQADGFFRISLLLLHRFFSRCFFPSGSPAPHFYFPVASFSIPRCEANGTCGGGAADFSSIALHRRHTDGNSIPTTEPPHIYFALEEVPQ